MLAIPICFFALFAVFAFMDPQGVYNYIENWSLWVRDWFGNFYLVLGFFSVIFLLCIAISPLGKVKLGTPKDTPEHSRWSWIAMLYSAGMGAGILLRAVQEPVFMFVNPPLQTGTLNNTLALEYTFYQWGLTAWAFYGLFALIIGYYLFSEQKKGLISASVAGSVHNQWVLNTIDILVIITTVFGLVGAIDLGTTQINGGLNHLSDYQFTINHTIGITVIICLLASFSAWKGINKGIKNISKVNILITFLLLLFVLLNSNFISVLKLFFNALYHYIVDFIPLSLALGNYNPGKAFLTDWTYYYWAFWLAWAPFTGVFIARISKGRTIREMLLGVMVIPSLGTFLWFSSFGDHAFRIIENWGSYNNEFGNVFTSVFVFFSEFPYHLFINMVVVLLLAGFLLTSIDSAIFVLSMFTDKGKTTPKKAHRLLWGIIVTVFCIAMLMLGNARPDIDMLIALQKILIITSLPFAIFIPIMCFLFLRELIKNR
ncbi:BCCT family transporter [Galbibacter sp. PAP.153]|uniref:BCCT family transporter n=1 Tax=Galbibacter sp. PAP.153 TaxID=3104623 RepID=UPI003009DFA3